MNSTRSRLQVHHQVIRASRKSVRYLRQISNWILLHNRVEIQILDDQRLHDFVPVNQNFVQVNLRHRLLLQFSEFLHESFLVLVTQEQVHLRQILVIILNNLHVLNQILLLVFTGCVLVVLPFKYQREVFAVKHADPTVLLAQYYQKSLLHFNLVAAITCVDGKQVFILTLTVLDLHFIIYEPADLHQLDLLFARWHNWPLQYEQRVSQFILRLCVAVAIADTESIR